MNESTIADDFLGQPNALYESPEKLSPEARRELFEFEESLAACLAFETVRGPALNREEDIAGQADRLLAADPDTEIELNAADRSLVSRAYLDARIMQDSALVSETLPEVLKLVVDRTLVETTAGNANASSAIPAIVLQIRDGLKVIKSALQGLELQTESIVATRNAVAAPEARKSHVILKQTVDGRDIEYQILSESESAITLVVRFSNGGSLNKIRAVLRREGRMLDSRSPDASGQVSFEHLSAGSYELEFTGALRHSCPILIDG